MLKKHGKLGFQPPAWEVFFEIHLKDLYRYVNGEMVRHGISHVVEADDLVQNLCCRLIENGDHRQMKMRSVGEVRAYLKVMARSVAIDWMRGRYAQKRGPQFQRVTFMEQSDRGYGVRDQRLEPEAEYLVFERLKACLNYCLMRLEGRNRQRDFACFLWSRLFGMTGKEIAMTLNGDMSPKGVYGLLARINRRVCDQNPLWKMERNQSVVHIAEKL